MMDTSLILNGDLHYQTSYRAGDITIPGYKTVDLRATLAGMFGAGVDISILVRNLFDVTYETGPGASSIGAGVISDVEAPPRTFGGSIAYRFYKADAFRQRLSTYGPDIVRFVFVGKSRLDLHIWY